jgi:MFS family permease
MIGALRQRNFALLWIGQLISMAGDWILLIALPFYIYDLTGSTLAAGGMFMAQNVPRVLLGSVAGVFVDRWDRRRTMIVADVARAVILLPLLLVRSVDWLWLVYVIAFLQTAISQFFGPAERALLPHLVSEADLVGANALNSLSESLTRLVAPALGGALYAALGLTSVVASDSISFAISAVMILLIALPRTETAPATDASATGIRWRAIWDEWCDGVRLIGHDRVIRAIFATIATAMVAEGFITVLLIPFVKDVLHQGPTGLGWLLSAQASGGIAGSLLLGRIGKRVSPALLIPLSGILFGIGDLALVNVTRYAPDIAFPLACALIALVGLPIICFFVSLSTLLQVAAGDAFRGRVFGAYMTLTALLTLAGQAVGGVLGDRIGIVPTLTAGACFDLLAGFVALVLLRDTRQPAAGGQQPVTSGQWSAVSDQ